MTVSTIKVLSAQSAAKEVLARELARYYLSHIEAGAHLNAPTHVDAEATLAQVRVADACIAAGNATPLTGVPITHKDVLVTHGRRATAGSKMLSDYVSPFDTTVVGRLGVAGMVTLGKTNVGEFAMGSSNENSASGVAKNPWNLEHVLGGSSDSSAAAVTASLVSAATGTDTGGSIRQPVSFSGITGIKLTYGRVSRYGMIVFVSSLDQGGPMVCTAENYVLLLSAMAGFDPRDSTSLEPGRDDDAEDLGRLLGQPLQGADATRPLAGLHIDLPKEYFGKGLADNVRIMVRAALAELEGLDATLVDISLPKTELSIPIYYVIVPTEAPSNLLRFDGVRYGYHAAEYRGLADIYCKSCAEGFGWEVKRCILVSAYVLSHGYYDAYYLQAQEIRRITAQDFQNALAGANRQCDVTMGPVALTAVWKLGEKTSDPVQTYLADTLMLSTSLAGLPGMSVPVGFGTNGLPVGLQIISNYFEEVHMLQIAHAFQQATDWHHCQPAA